jgi:hypothetical protein
MNNRSHGIIYRHIVLNKSGTARAYGCLRTSFSGLERDICRGGAVSLYRDLNASPLSRRSSKLDNMGYFDTLFLEILLLSHCFYVLQYYIESVIFRLTLMALSVCLSMGFRPPIQKERHRAIGSTQGLSSTIQRALDPGTDFNPISLPNPGEWLAEYDEPGQTVMDFLKAGPNKPDTLRNSIYLQPLVRFRENGSPSLETLRSCAGFYFAMPVKILPALDIGCFKFTCRINPYTRHRQIFTRDVLMCLKERFPLDAFCILAITMEDRYPRLFLFYVKIGFNNEVR